MSLESISKESRGPYLNTRISQSEHESLIEMARLAGVSKSEFVRRKLFGRRVDSPDLESTTFNELRRISVVLKNMHAEGLHNNDGLECALNSLKMCMEEIANDMQKNNLHKKEE